MRHPDYLYNRRPDSAKWDYGHALLLAGSYCRMGCAVLAARAAMRTGTGLLTAHVPTCSVDIMQTGVPEALVEVDSHPHFTTTLPSNFARMSAIAIGPGIGRNCATQEVFTHLLQNAPKQQPLIIDADALSILAENEEALASLHRCTAILTPHVREMERLGMAPDELAERYDVTVVLKGSSTAIYSCGGRKTLISTGNAGMATAGSGDVLTGILLGLVSQNAVYDSALALDMHELALLGVQIHGISGTIYAKKHPECTLVASDLIENLPDAIDALSDQ